jgi:hypothetical protein
MLCILSQFPAYQSVSTIKVADENFTFGKVYRYLNDDDDKAVFVNGMKISKKLFDTHFIDYPTFVLSKLKELGVYDKAKDKLVSLNSFKKDYCDVRTYGKGVNKSLVCYVGLPKDNLFQLYSIATTKTDAIKDAYYQLECILSGENLPLISGFLVWGNSGYPISLHDIRIK